MPAKAGIQSYCLLGMTDLDGPATVESSSTPPWRRRLFHAVAGSILPLSSFFVPEPYPAVVAGVLAAASLVLDLLRFRVEGLNRLFLRVLNPILKASEDRRVTGATWMLIASCLAFVFLDQTVAAAVLLFLSLGDPAAALVGQASPGPTIFGKSPVGIVAFVAVSSVVAVAVVLAGGTQAFWVLFAGAVVAAVVEFLPLPIDDNLTVPISAGLVIQYLPLLF